MSDLTNAIKQVCEEKGLSFESVVETIESALAAAYRKDFGEKNQNIKVEFDSDTGKSKVFDVKTVVEDLTPEELEKIESRRAKKQESPDLLPGQESGSRLTRRDKKTEEGAVILEPSSAEATEGEEKKFNPRTEIQFSDAKVIKKTAKVGDELKMKLEAPAEYGRMAAQTAKQVIIQRLREVERNMIFNEFKNKENEVVSGVIQRREGRVVLVDLGRTAGILPAEEQIYNEGYTPGARIKVFVKSVNVGPRGPEIILSRTSDEILKKVFYLEIPEISNGLVELKAVAREAGARSKVAVAAVSENIDPIGSCVGQRGARIQTIISELGGEKIDIIQHDDDPEKFIVNALSPAKIIGVKLDKKKRGAVVMVASDQLSLAIGRGGQNVRLAAKLTGWRIDIVEKGAEKAPSASSEQDPAASPEQEKEDAEGEEEQKNKKATTAHGEIPPSIKNIDDEKKQENKEGGGNKITEKKEEVKPKRKKTKKKEKNENEELEEKRNNPPAGETKNVEAERLAEENKIKE